MNESTQMIIDNIQEESSQIINEESNIKVYVSDCYKIFKKMKGNRDINELNLAKLRKSMEDQCWITPIYVNEFMEVVDGQHRLTVLEEMGKSVYYIILNGATTDTVHNFNNVNLKWSLLDYAKSYADLGLSEYVKFMEHYNRHEVLPVKVLYLLLNKTGNDSKGLAAFKNGELELASDLEIEHVTGEMEIFKECKNYKYNSFLLAILKVIKYPGYDSEKMKHKIEQSGLSILDRYTNPSLQHTLQLLSEVYNKNCRAGDLVQFESMYNVRYFK